jgi:hypothetical protein
VEAGMTIEQIIIHTAYVVKQQLTNQYILILLILAFNTVVNVSVWIRVDNIMRGKK